MLSRWLRNLWHHIEAPEASLAEIQERHRRQAGYRLLPAAWEPCRYCGKLISGGHRCPTIFGEERERSPEIKALQKLLVALEIQQREARKSTKVLPMTRKRASA